MISKSFELFDSFGDIPGMSIGSAGTPTALSFISALCAESASAAPCQASAASERSEISVGVISPRSNW